MDFYAHPSELEGWLDNVLADRSNWLVAWDVRPDAYMNITLQDRLSGAASWGIAGGPGPYFFIGNRLLTNGPKMSVRAGGKEEISFLESLCVRLVPSFIHGPVLLEGTIGSFQLKKYRQVANGHEFLLWKNKLILSLKKKIFQVSAVAAQVRADGSEKIWHNVLVSPAAIDWVAQGGKLRQFERGPVEFFPRVSNFH
jgi:hypothetical protein